MTYEVKRMTSRGNTLQDKLRAQFGERTARSLQNGIEAGRRRQAENGRNTAAANRTITQVMRTVKAKPAVTQRSPSVMKTNSRPRPAERRYTVPAPSRYATPQDLYRTKNPYRVRVNYMKKPVTGRSDLEISIATFPRAYDAGVRAKRCMQRGGIEDRNARRAGVRRGYRAEDVREEGSALDHSVKTMAAAYRRGQRMREITHIESAKPTPADAVGITKKSFGAKFVDWARTLAYGKGRQNAELRVKKTPFPISAMALILVCTVVLLVAISSFAQLSEYRSDISALEAKQEKLESEKSRLTGLVESREDVRVIDKIATEDIGMISAELASGRFVSLADVDRVEVVDSGEQSEKGVFATLLSAIAENVGRLSEYIN